MTLFDDIQVKAKEHFPTLDIKYKNESTFMKILGILLFFNKSFMTTYTTTIGSTVYFPSRDFVNKSPTSATTILLHELVHIYDALRLNKVLFGFLYLSPQILTLLALPLLLISWKLSLLCLIFLAPTPAYFRMMFEKKAYTYSLHVLNKLSIKNHFNVNLETQAASYVNQFQGPFYLFMWPFNDIKTYFDSAVLDIKAGKRPPYEQDLSDTIDKILN